MTPAATAAIRVFAASAFLWLSTPTRAADYFVAPDGNDANPGTSESPWLTVSKAAASVQAGDTVTIRAGTYRESAWLSSSGLPDAPILFTAEPGAIFESPNPDASEEAFNIGPGVGYVRLVGIRATGGFHETIFVRTEAHHIEISDCELYGNRIGILLGSAHDVTISRCSLHNNGRAGIRFAGSTHDVTVSDTESFSNDDGLGCDGEADGFASDGGAAVARITFLGAKAYGNGEDGFDMPASEVVFDRVESFNNTCAGIKLWHSATLTNCLARGNLTGIVTSSPGNTAYAITNCTIADNGIGISLKAPSAPEAVYEVNLLNNVISGPNQALDWHDPVRLYEAQNVLWRGGRDDLYRTLIKRYTASGRQKLYTGHDVNIRKWERREDQGGGTLAVDPLLDAIYCPASTSAAVDRARADAAPASDFNGTRRPQGPAADIGAIEIPGGTTNHPPFADAGLSRTARVGRRVRFKSKGTVDPDQDILTYSWDFGDGSPPVPEPRTRHAFSAPGVYMVTLTVSDGELIDRATVTVTVTNE